MLCLVTRIINSFLVQTYFNPDEHWQALEVAHRNTFGYGHLTWEWKKGIRSYLHRLLFAALYKVLAFLGLDIPWFMIRAPRLLFAALGDLYLYKFSLVFVWRICGKLGIVSLYYWPCMRVSSSAATSDSRMYALALTALACALRPTSAITWIYVGFLELLLTREKLEFVFLEVVPIGEEKGIMDESDQFLMDPLGFANEFAKNWSQPSHIVLFDSQEKHLKEFLSSHQFHEVKRFFHAHFKVDRELQSSVVVYSFQGQ